MIISVLIIIFFKYCSTRTERYIFFYCINFAYCIPPALLCSQSNYRNIKDPAYPYWQYTDFFIFRFVSLLCLRSTLRLFQVYPAYVSSFNASFQFSVTQNGKDYHSSQDRGPTVDANHNISITNTLVFIRRVTGVGY